MHNALVTITLLGTFGLYLLPALVGYARGHENRLPIFVLNALLGWTLLGWVAALVWACTANVRGRAGELGRAEQATTTANKGV